MHRDLDHPLLLLLLRTFVELHQQFGVGQDFEGKSFYSIYYTIVSFFYTIVLDVSSII